MEIGENRHILNLIPDYVLDLLPGEQKMAVERHLTICAGCRQAVQQERQIGHLLRQTMQAASRPAPERLAGLQPAPPGGWKLLWATKWPRQAATLALLLLLFVGFLGLQQQNERPIFWPGQNTPWTMTATLTEGPTMTATLTAVSSPTQAEPISELNRLSLPYQPLDIEPQPVPAPVKTPAPDH